MKRFLKRLVPFVLALGILASIGWYLLEYDREFTRDMLISQARFFDNRGNTDLAAKLYHAAYNYTGQDEDVAIELANQYRADGNYTKAEYTLTNAIADGGTAELYIALCKTFVEQDKLLDAVNMLDSISDPAIKAELDALRPAAPLPNYEPGFYSEYLNIEFDTSEDTLYCTTDGDYPSLSDDPTTEPISLPGGETVIRAIRVSKDGLVSPLTHLGYTIGGVIEEAVFTDPAIESAIRELLGAEADEVLMTDRLWDILEFTIPADAGVLTDLALLPYLEKISAENFRFDSLSFLGGLTKLTEVKFVSCAFPVDDMTILAGLPQLERLTLSDCGLSTIAGLAGAQQLTYLDLSENALRKLDALIPMTTLEELYLQHNAVTNLDALITLTRLNTLDISYNSVSSIAPLAACTQLARLNAGNNQLTSLTGIDTFPALTPLSVDHNQLRNVSILGKCTGIIELNLSNNRIQSLNELNTLVSMTTLNCSYNEMTHLPIWPVDCALTTLDCSHNEIASLNPLTNLQELTYVYLDYNLLTTLDPLANCYRLVMVNAYGNKIPNVSKLTEHNIIVNYDPTN